MLSAAQIKLFIKRDDLLDTELGGNKWRKLKYNLLAAEQAQYKTLLTFGGAWSNHIYATAAAGNRFGFNTIGVIRGERPKNLSSTLQFAESNNMVLKFVTREQYRLKDNLTFIQALQNELGDFYCIPEGGSNTLALQGVTEIIDEIDINFDVITCACGTGTTLAGLVKGLNNHQIANGYAVLKGADFLNADVKQKLADQEEHQQTLFNIETDYHFGGYAKVDKPLTDFIISFNNEFGIPLDAVYTGKMFYGLFEQIKNNVYKPETTIIALHTGGLQGNAGFSALKDINS